MRNRLTSLIVALPALLVFLLVTVPLNGQSPMTNLPFDPHDLNGIWNRTGGDRGYNNDVVPMTPSGEAKMRASTIVSNSVVIERWSNQVRNVRCGRG